MPSELVLSSVLGIAAVVLLWVKKSRQKRHILPPGPPGVPLIGHLLDIPAENQDLALYELGKIYGDVICLKLFGRSIIVLNSVEAAIDLLEKRSANYSDRPYFPIFELMGWRKTLTFTRYGKSFRKYRRMFQGHLKPTKIISYQSLQTKATRILLQSLFSDEGRKEDWLRRFATSIVTQITYGHQITSDEDPYLDIMERVSHAVSNAGAPGNTPVDLFPFLRYFPSWFPGAYYAGLARKHEGAITKLHDYPFDKVIAEMAAGTAKPSFVQNMLEAISHDGLENEKDVLDIKGTAATMYCAGAETTWTTLIVFFLAMVLHPECQKRAQEEIDSVIGPGRLPEFSDREFLPYVECVLQETLRWNPVVPLGVPHCSLEDDIYRGMFIPKGSLVIANTRGMVFDQEVYTDPQTYNPSRYLPLPEGNHEPHPSGPFGFGRRICPGRHLADSSIWIAIASILTTFNVLRPIGVDGEELIPEVKFSTGITSQPSSFNCRIRPRNDHTRDLIINTETFDAYQQISTN